jgi:hypothetical protein
VHFSIISLGSRLHCAGAVGNAILVQVHLDDKRKKQIMLVVLHDYNYKIHLQTFLFLSFNILGTILVARYNNKRPRGLNAQLAMELINAI